MNARSSPNQLSIERYRRRAEGYDSSAERTMPLRRRTVELLHLQPGQTVLDVGCGTGLSFGLLLEGVGRQGQVLGFEQSPEMHARAAQRVRQNNWDSLWLCQSAAEDVTLPAKADAVLFNYVHDISRTPAAVDNIMRQVKPGAHVAVAGMKFFPWWTGPLNLLAWLKNRPYNALAADLWQPWDLIEPWCVDFHRWTTQAGMGYIAHGRRKKDPP